MGLHTASWMSPLTALAVAVVLAYACGLWFSLRLSRGIVTVIESLNTAAARVGAGDFSATIPDVANDQLGGLITAFNDMTRGLGQLREHERQRAAFDRELTLANETQQRLYPPVQPELSSASVWGMTAPARIVSGDLYDFIRFSDHELTLVCADVSGKGMPAASLMTHLQAIARGRMLGRDELGALPSPVEVVAVVNEDLRGRFGDHRYATMIYGDFDSRTGVLRYVNAGHCRPIVIADNGDVTTLPDGDFPNRLSLAAVPRIRSAHTEAKGSTRSVAHAGRFLRCRKAVHRSCRELPRLGNALSGTALFSRSHLLGRICATSSDFGRRSSAPRPDPRSGGRAC